MVLRAHPYIFGIRGVRRMGKNRVLNENQTFYFFAPPNDYVWLSIRVREGAILKTLSYFFHLFETFKIIQAIQIFFHDSNVFKLFILFNKPWLCLPLINFVYLCLPLFIFVYHRLSLVSFVYLSLFLFKWRIYAQILCLLK